MTGPALRISELNSSPFHEGELEIQRRMGVEEKMDVAGRHGIRQYMPDQHREFFSQLPFIVAASVDDHHQPWATLLCNPPGFVTSIDATRLIIRALPDMHDPLHELLDIGKRIGLLGIQFDTRRRNRMNGRVISQDSGELQIQVQQSFGNCPKYIQARQCEYVASTADEIISVNSAETLNDTTRRIIHDADTFFIASAYPDARSEHDRNETSSHGVDVSHRGGKPGFVHVEGNTLVVPDYVGNFFFNTLGNLLVNPKAGLLLVDFDGGGSLLHIAATTDIVWDGPELHYYPGAQRLLKFSITQIVHVQRRIPLRWQGWQLSPHLIDK